MHKAKKSLGQNFLQDEQIIANIIHQAHITEKDQVIEIGPGLGALTRHILAITKEIQVIEFDTDVVLPLKAACAAYGKLNIRQQDVLTVNFNDFYQGQKIKLIGNLPYNISSPLLFHLIDYAQFFKDMHFMLQKEVVDRIVAYPSEKNYGRLSVMLQYHFKCEGLFDVPAHAFHPKPKVESRILRLTPYVKPPIIAKNYQLFSEIVKQTFQMRRKTLRNTLKVLVCREKMQSLPIDVSLRPENLSVSDFVMLSNYIGAHSCQVI
ncbi:16S rRNA (adenine(1518)-N(6)/adenine(1519)-N(6))-dimethyltransferase RsmA [Fastidiosibacter lacustris]|uniref:16S rRNA (adenine(1518)-N(6)/adenine(1519)-N(6))- dimethyltransferase RsmA n=1 Tax=Fastidiosibacter lacustris TaxID=2056695 RepID=UPI000E34EE1B|nr:16S rRNA (adenine(1518)-N(6)/adenine(1519)-N(6))-dimethyltransferase RsmA [Fastidiosibacter lacustris]